MKKINLFVFALVFVLFCSAQTTSTFENLVLAPDTFWTGSDNSGGFSSGNAYFTNIFDATYHYWSDGFAYTDKKDSSTSGYTNEYSAITAGGVNGSSNYAVAYDAGAGNVKIRLTGTGTGKSVEGVFITNTTYTYKSMLHGDSYEHAFDSSDYYLLKITGWKNGNPINDTVNFYLADFRAYDSTERYIVKQWQWVNLLSLGNVDSLVFSVSGSQVDTNGYLNTPAYFALDNLVTADLPTTYITMFYNQDTIINVLANLADTTGGPFSLHIIGNTIPGASIAIDSANQIFYIPQQGVNGTDTITYTICNAANQCDTAQIVIRVEGTDGIRNINQLMAKVYPNPFSNSFTVYHTADVKTVTLYDLEGKLISEMTCNTGETITSVNTGNLSAGIYMVRVVSDNGVGVAKITKQ